MTPTAAAIIRALAMIDTPQARALSERLQAATHETDDELHDAAHAAVLYALRFPEASAMLYTVHHGVSR